jgi:hypothetical protein
LKRLPLFFRYGKWLHWNKKFDPETVDIYKNRRERFIEKNEEAEEIVSNFKNAEHINFMRNVWRNHRMPKVFVNMENKVENFKAQGKLIELFKYRKFETPLNIFIKYFRNNEIRENFFNKKDYEIDYKMKLITIKNCLIIPILGILKMIDDFKNDNLKKGFELCPYATHTDSANEKAYTEIRRDQIRKGECQKLFELHPLSFTNYDRNYELKNWNAYLAYNGVKYFYWVQDKQHIIVEEDKHAFIDVKTHQIYKFLYSSNPIDLISVVQKIQEYD